MYKLSNIIYNCEDIVKVLFMSQVSDKVKGVGMELCRSYR